MKQDQIDPIVGITLRNISAGVWRHSENKEPEFLCMATFLGYGIFATVRDRGVENPYFQNSFTDIRLHLNDEKKSECFVRYAGISPVGPIAFMKVGPTESQDAGPDIVAISEMVISDGYVYRIGYGGGIFSNGFDRIKQEIKDGLKVTEGYTIDTPRINHYRKGSDDNFDNKTIVVEACFNYPGQKDLGSPVVNNKGKLAGILIGGDLGPQCSHQGAYIPIEFVLPFAKCMEFKFEEIYRANVFHRFDSVQHFEEE